MSQNGNPPQIGGENKTMFETTTKWSTIFPQRGRFFLLLSHPGLTGASGIREMHSFGPKMGKVGNGPQGLAVSCWNPRDIHTAI